MLKEMKYSLGQQKNVTRYCPYIVFALNYTVPRHYMR